jgi:hypothetical protein
VSAVALRAVTPCDVVPCENIKFQIFLLLSKFYSSGDIALFVMSKTVISDFIRRLNYKIATFGFQ